MVEKRTMVIVCGTLAAVLIGVPLVLIVYSAFDGIKCELCENEPKAVKASDLCIEVSADNRAVAKFDGHLLYLVPVVGAPTPIATPTAAAGSGNGAGKNQEQAATPAPATAPQPPTPMYMPLELESVEVTKEPNGAVDLLLMRATCANITLKLVPSADKKQINIDAIEVDMLQPNGDYKSCKVTDLKIDYPANNHYACKNKPMRFACTVKSKAVLQLVVNSIEFELDGDAASAKEGKFSKPTKSCPD